MCNAERLHGEGRSEAAGGAIGDVGHRRTRARLTRCRPDVGYTFSYESEPPANERVPCGFCVALSGSLTICLDTAS